MSKTKGLNANQLKLIAIIAMTIDHIVWTVCPGYSTVWWVVILHVIGRLTAPIMWFFIAEGYYHTRNFKKYVKDYLFWQLFHILPIIFVSEFHLSRLKRQFLIRRELCGRWLGD